MNELYKHLSFDHFLVNNDTIYISPDDFHTLYDITYKVNEASLKNPPLEGKMSQC